MKNISNEIKSKYNCFYNYMYNCRTIIDKENLQYSILNYSIPYSNKHFLCNEKKQNYKHKISFKFNSNLLIDKQQNLVFKKYWPKRYRLFSKFDDGIRLDCGKFSYVIYILIYYFV
jgi:hypothetical protein